MYSAPCLNIVDVILKNEELENKQNLDAKIK